MMALASESRNTSRCEDAVSVTLVISIAAAGIGGLAAAGCFLFLEVERVGLQTSFHSMMGVAY